MGCATSKRSSAVKGSVIGYRCPLTKSDGSSPQGGRSALRLSSGVLHAGPARRRRTNFLLSKDCNAWLRASPSLSRNPSGARSMKGRPRQGGRARRCAKLMVGHHRSHSPILRKAVEVVRSGVLGSIGRDPGRRGAAGERARRVAEPSSDRCHLGSHKERPNR